MQIIDATVTRARRSRDFGRVEARVVLRYRPYPGAAAERRSILTSVALGRAAGPLRARLVDDAVRTIVASMPAPMAEAA